MYEYFRACSSERGHATLSSLPKCPSLRYQRSVVIKNSPISRQLLRYLKRISFSGCSPCFVPAVAKRNTNTCGICSQTPRLVSNKLKRRNAPPPAPLAFLCSCSEIQFAPCRAPAPAVCQPPYHSSYKRTACCCAGYTSAACCCAAYTSRKHLRCCYSPFFLPCLAPSCPPCADPLSPEIYPLTHPCLYRSASTSILVTKRRYVANHTSNSLLQPPRAKRLFQKSLV